MENEIKWDDLTKEDMNLIQKICKRYHKMRKSLKLKPTDHQSLDMDISAAHLDIPMNLQKLLDFPDFDFAHDISGIMSHINRITGKIEKFFLPRASR